MQVYFVTCRYTTQYLRKRQSTARMKERVRLANIREDAKRFVCFIYIDEFHLFMRYGAV